MAREFFRPALCALGLLMLSLWVVTSAQPTEVPRFAGFWLTALVSLDDPRWRIEDLACARTGCSVAAFEYLQTLLRDPANDERTMRELMADTAAYNSKHISDLLTAPAKEKAAQYDPAEGAALDCDPDGDGWRHQILAPLPIVIEQYPDKVMIRYEYWNAVRTIYMDGREHPKDAEPSRLGHSIGRYEGATLVVETTAITPNLIGIPGGGALLHSEDAVAFEHYTLGADGSRLDLEWSVVDPVHFQRPLTGQRSSLSLADGELDEFVCEAITGEF